MPKRKRVSAEDPAAAHKKTGKSARFASSPEPQRATLASTTPSHEPIYVQIVTGSYERTLHGITAAIPASIIGKRDDAADKPEVQFTDSFLFNAHTSAIKCLAISPPPAPDAASQKLILATGSTDEKINLFHLSTRPPKGPILPTLGSKTQQNASNRSLGTLHTHDASVTALHFPNRTKLLSACGNNVIAVTSTRSFNTLSLIKAPTPKHPNRPTGDTSTASTLPSGVNDFAVHPSMKLMISVGRAEKCMRLWNLVTGKKAGVLSFEKDMLKAVGEGVGRWGSGEGRRVLWDPEGEEFAIAFERGVCIFGMDCVPRGVILPSTTTRLHQLHYLPATDKKILAVSTEDGRVMFYSTEAASGSSGKGKAPKEATLPSCKLLGQLGGAQAAILGRIKDFELIELPRRDENKGVSRTYLLITAGSDGSIRMWRFDEDELNNPLEESANTSAPQLGQPLAIYETNNRITCLKSFLLSGEPEDEELGHGGAGYGSADEDEEGMEEDDSDEDEDNGSDNALRVIHEEDNEDDEDADSEDEE